MHGKDNGLVLGGHQLLKQRRHVAVGLGLQLRHGLWAEHINARIDQGARGGFFVNPNDVCTVGVDHAKGIMLPIRMREGILRKNLSQVQQSNAEPYTRSGHIDLEKWGQGTLQLTPQGRLIADRIVRELVV